MGCFQTMFSVLLISIISTAVSRQKTAPNAKMASSLAAPTAEGLGLLTTHGLPTSRDSRIPSGAASERGLTPMASGSSAEGGLSKRDISLNQDLRSLARMLLTREYNRILSERRIREFLRKIGKRNGRLGVDPDLDAEDDALDVLP